MGVIIALTAASVDADPGAESVLEARVENTGQVVDRILIDVLGAAKEWAEVDSPHLNLHVLDPHHPAAAGRHPGHRCAGGERGALYGLRQTPRRQLCSLRDARLRAGPDRPGRGAAGARRIPPAPGRGDGRRRARPSDHGDGRGRSGAAVRVAGPYQGTDSAEPDPADPGRCRRAVPITGQGIRRDRGGAGQRSGRRTAQAGRARSRVPGTAEVSPPRAAPTRR